MIDHERNPEGNASKRDEMASERGNYPGNPAGAGFDQMGRMLKKAHARSRLALGAATIALVVAGVLAVDRTAGPIRISLGDTDAPASPATRPTYDQQAGAVPNPVVIADAGRQAPLTSTADGIRVITHEGATFAMDAVSGAFFRFEGESMTPVEADPATLPAEAVAKLRAGGVQQPAVADTTEQYNRAMALNQQIAEGSNAELRINAMLAEKDTAEKILATLSKAAGIDADGTDGMENAVYVFFDATCPWCHKLYEDMDGKLDSKWLPTLALGDAGVPLIGHIMGEGAIEIVKDAQGNPDHVSVKPDAQRHERLRQVVGESWRGATGGMTPEIDFITRENETLMSFLYGKQINLSGVPTIIVALPDGTARMINGYEDDTVAKILELQGRKGN